MFNLSEPSQRTTNDWVFIDELRSELHRKPHWDRETSYPGEPDLTKGVRILKDYPDPEGLLDTAWQDLERFLKDMSIPVGISMLLPNKIFRVNHILMFI